MTRRIVDLHPEAIAEGREVGFPYRLIYWTDGESSVVLAIAHSKRCTGYWRERLSR